MSDRTTEALLSREYPITLYKAEEDGFVAEHRDLPGCLTQGETIDEAVGNLASARRLWITTAVANGDEVPLPSTDEQYGGRVLVRMARSMHRRLVEEAEREAVSLNQFLVGLLSEGLVGRTTLSALGRMEAGIQALTERISEIADVTSRFANEHEKMAWTSNSDQVEAVFELVAQLTQAVPGKGAPPWQEGAQRTTRRRGQVRCN